ncbi:zinc finger CCHC domain-containing protein 17-like isoform X2 [Prorops nasuta]|uniref:zinc finger CCHC domain-containing protein 17-like isoform X2 n=1 Tax=Prorops nasuta TaxID=863751 RepID=UPI0034CE6B4C
MTACELNKIFLGQVVSVQDYGAFIRIPECSQQGLVHKSQISNSHIDKVADILQKHDKIWCKIISIDDQGKIGLSMKYVNQGNGQDLDPNGVSLQMDLQRKKSVVTHSKKVIKFEAILNTTCKKCGTHGHLSTDCFMAPGGKKYELIPEIQETKEDPQEELQTDETMEKRKTSSSQSSSTFLVNIFNPNLLRIF